MSLSQFHESFFCIGSLLVCNTWPNAHLSQTISSKMHARQITVFYLWSSTIATAYFDSSPILEAREIQDTGEYSYIHSRDKLETKNILYTRDTVYNDINSNLDERDPSLDDLLPRTLEDSLLPKRVLASIEVTDRIDAFKRETSAITAKYADEKQSLNKLLHPKTGASDATLEALAKYIASKNKNQNIPTVGALKDDAARQAMELEWEGRGKEAKALVRAQKEYNRAWGRYSRFANVIVVQYEEYKRTGTWPRKGGGGGSKAAGEKPRSGGVKGAESRLDGRTEGASKMDRQEGMKLGGGSGSDGGKRGNRAERGKG